LKGLYTPVLSFLLIIAHTSSYIADSFLNKCFTHSTYTTISISIAEKNSSLNLLFSELFQVKTSFCCPINQYINLFSSGHRNPDLFFYFSQVSTIFFGVNLSGHFNNFSISSKVFPWIFLKILNLLESVSRTGFILKATGLYFLA